MIAHPYIARMKAISPAQLTGRIQKVTPGYVEADGPLSAIGDVCHIECQSGVTANAPHAKVMAEVASIQEGRAILIPFDQTASIVPGAKVAAGSVQSHVPVGDVFSGRLVNALARPLDELPAIFTETTYPLLGDIVDPLSRQATSNILQTGVRAIDGLLTIGQGQRMGIFAASGVGKTTLLNQLSRQVDCDRCVICLVGERGREVESLWQHILDADDTERYSCVAATSDQSAVLRVRAVHQALCLAEYWRAQGEHVLLMVDSVTRYAMALREIGLAAGAPPTRRAYTPNVFEALPRLVERCGGVKSGGSITAIMTILSETDDVDDPIAEVMKSLLDGHIILSRTLAEQGHFPAIDVVKSISRLSTDLMDTAHTTAARSALASLSIYDDSRIMIESGIYKSGSNPKLDLAVDRKDALSSFLIQSGNQKCLLDETLSRLQSITEIGGNHA